MSRRLVLWPALALALGAAWWLRGSLLERRGYPGAPVRAVAEGAAGADLEARLLPLPSPADEREVRAAGLEVLVRDEAETPVAGATVSVVDAACAQTTGADGRCRLPIERAEVLELEVSAPGHVGFRDRFPWDEKRLVLVLPRPGTLRGRVVTHGEVGEQPVEQPVAEARVHVRQASRWRPALGEASTAADGSFRLERVPLGTPLVACASARGFPERVARVFLHGDESEVLLPLAALPAVLVQVVEWPGGAPIAGASVSEGCADAEGRVWLEREERGFLFWASAPGFCALRGGWRLTEISSPLVLPLPRAAFVEGLVRDQDGAPVAGAELRFEPAGDATLLPPLPRHWAYSVEDAGAARSALDGRYRSPPFLPGQRALRVRASRPGTGEAEAELGPLGDPGSVARLDLTLAPRPSGTVAGHVRFRDQWTSGSVRWKGARHDGAGELDLEDEYRLEDVDAGWVELEARAGPKELQPLLPGTRARVFVEVGGTTRQDFDLSLPLAEIGGHVVHADGTPAEDVPYTVGHRDPRYQVRRKSKRGGAWSLSVPDLGWEYELDFSAGNSSVHLAGVRAGDTQLEVVLPDLGWLTVLAVDAEGQEPPQEWDLLWRHTGAGAFERVRDDTLELAPGLVDVRVETPGLGWQPGEVDGVRVEAGVASSVRVLLRRGLELELDLQLDPALADAAVYLCAPEGAYPAGSQLGRILVAPDDFGVVRCTGLTPGRWRFEADPDDARFEPAAVSLPCASPLLVRGVRRE